MQARQQNADWMFGGSGAYAPLPGSSAVDMKLRLHETVNVFDAGLVPHPARALLDSGAPCKQSMHGSPCTRLHPWRSRPVKSTAAPAYAADSSLMSDSACALHETIPSHKQMPCASLSVCASLPADALTPCGL